MAFPEYLVTVSDICEKRRQLSPRVASLLFHVTVPPTNNTLCQVHPNYSQVTLESQEMLFVLFSSIPMNQYSSGIHIPRVAYTQNRTVLFSSLHR